MIEPEELRDIYEFLPPKDVEPKLGPIFITKDGRFINLGKDNEHSSIFGESDYDSEDYQFLEDNYGLIKANGGNRLEPIPYIDLWNTPNEAQRRAISEWVDLLMASGKRSVQVNSGFSSSVVEFDDNTPKDICKDIVRFATRPIKESLVPGQRVSISNTGTFWDGKEGVLEEIDEVNSSCTIFVDFDSEGNKKVRQDFDLANVFDADNTNESPKYNLDDKVLQEDAQMESLKEELNKDDGLRKKTLADYLNVSIDKIKEHANNEGINAFDVGDGIWLVLTKDEAEDIARKNIMDTYDDMGLEAFSPDFQELIMHNFLDDDILRNIMSDYYYLEADNMEDEPDSTFGDELTREMYDHDLLKDGDFRANDDGSIDFTHLKQGVDFGELLDKFIKELVDENEPVEWLEDNFKDGDIADLINQYEGLLDIDKVVEECLRADGVSPFITFEDEYLDSDEVDFGNGLYGFKVN